MRAIKVPPYSPPYSHRAGVRVWLPGAFCVAQLFPTLVELSLTSDDYQSKTRISFPELGSVSDWTVYFHLLRRELIVEGKGKEGFFRYRIESAVEGVYFRSLKGSMVIEIDGQKQQVGRSERVVLMGMQNEEYRFPVPRLFLGVSKSPCLERISQRADIREMFQCGYPLMMPERELPREVSLQHCLLKELVMKIKARDREDLLKIFAFVFRSGIRDFFVPVRFDDQFWGEIPVYPSEFDVSLIPSIIISCMRALFIQEERVVTFLPVLPKEYLSGRLLHERLASGHLLDLEWRKGRLRRCIIEAKETESVGFLTPGWSQCSVRSLSLQKKQPYQLGTAILLQKGERYLFDNFSS